MLTDLLDRHWVGRVVRQTLGWPTVLTDSVGRVVVQILCWPTMLAGSTIRLLCWPSTLAIRLFLHNFSDAVGVSVFWAHKGNNTCGYLDVVSTHSYPISTKMGCGIRWCIYVCVYVHVYVVHTWHYGVGDSLSVIHLSSRGTTLARFVVLVCALGLRFPSSGVVLCAVQAMTCLCAALTFVVTHPGCALEQQAGLGRNVFRRVVWAGSGHLLVCVSGTRHAGSYLGHTGFDLFACVWVHAFN